MSAIIWNSTLTRTASRSAAIADQREPQTVGLETTCGNRRRELKAGANILLQRWRQAGMLLLHPALAAPVVNVIVVAVAVVAPYNNGSDRSNCECVVCESEIESCRMFRNCSVETVAGVSIVWQRYLATMHEDLR